MSHLSAVQETVFRVTNELPQRHTLTRLFRGARFKRATEEFLTALHSLEWKHFKSPRDFLFVEQALQIVIGTIQLHMLETYTTKHTSECQYFSDIVAKLKDSLAAVQQGLPPDPAKRPKQRDLELAVDDRLRHVLTNRRAAAESTDQSRVPVGTRSTS